MKLSLSWIFDHLDADWRTVDVPDLIERFNRTTAEIEGFKKIELDSTVFVLGEIILCDSIRGTLVTLLESGEQIQLPFRDDVHVHDTVVLVADQNKAVQWATTTSFGGAKERLLAPVAFQASSSPVFDAIDYVLDIDNKSINHRPDLWSHRGVAREISMLLSVRLRPLSELMAHLEVLHCDGRKCSGVTIPYSIGIQAGGGCSHFSALFISQVAYQPSSLLMAARLARLDIRPINFFVDLTNYVMLDLGQPMHVFDADRLVDKELIVKRARGKETIRLLDGELVELTPDDMIVASGKTPVSLAGVMGGLDTAVSRTTKNILLEAAHFDGATIRQMATRHKKRTESSMRFEKSLDAYGLIDALCRYVYVAGTLITKPTTPIMIVGAVTPEPVIIQIEHQFLERQLGCSLISSTVIGLLQAIDFTVSQQVVRDATVYNVEIPSFRSGKDIRIKEDIVEEVGRLIGYGSLVPKTVYGPQRATDTHVVHVIRTIKTTLAYGLLMKELYNYSLFDESFLATISWLPEKSELVMHPVSDNWRRLVTTLIPHLLKAVAENSIHHNSVRFFEWGRTWNYDANEILQEKKQLAGIFFSQQEAIFYDAKAELKKLFDALGITVSWQQVQEQIAPWFEPYQTAYLMHEGIRIGVAGVVPFSIMQHIATKGYAFVFELDGDALLLSGKEQHRLIPLSKYPVVYRDLSVLAPKSMTSNTIEKLITTVDSRIKSVELLDFFEKKEWLHERALTYRFEISDEKTLVGSEIDALIASIVVVLSKNDVRVR